MNVTPPLAGVEIAVGRLLIAIDATTGRRGDRARTLDTYSHAVPALEEESAEKVARMMFGT